MNNPTSSCVYGPVPSRRLGRSLGVDLIPFKRCTYDCIYCQLGRTTDSSLLREEWRPTNQVLQNVRNALEMEPELDYVCIAGSGEPTLHSGIGEIINGIKTMTEVPIAVLTNGSLLHMPEVRKGLTGASLVLPSLDAANSLVFEAVNRPHPRIHFKQVVSGIKDFCKEFDGEVWLDVMILGGYTAIPEEIRHLSKIVDEIKPDRVQFNTAVRPTAETFARKVKPAYLKQLAKLMDPPAEVIVGREIRPVQPLDEVTAEKIFDLLCRRPCSANDISTALGINQNNATKLLDHLVGKNAIELCGQTAGGQYRVNRP